MPLDRVRRTRSAALDPLIAVPLVVGVLSFGKPVILPLVLATLGAFVLSPFVSYLEQRGPNRLTAVLMVVLLAGTVLGVGLYGVAQQIGGLMRELPEHTQELQDRAKAVRDASSPVSDAIATLERISGVAKTQRSRTVFVEQREGLFSGALEYVRIAAGPMATFALVAVFCIFMLVSREDLRNRLISVMGGTGLVGATRILVDSGQRLSRMIATQLLINAGLGLTYGLGLWILGVPYWFLWGALTMVLRFVPFVGAWLAALLPFAVSLLFLQGWAKPLAALGLFAVLDLITANGIEPWLLGKRTGVSPIALLVAAVFWSWIWGPVGLLVSTPLTLCLVVLGRHVPRLHFLSNLLGDEQPLSPLEVTYQRLLAEDEREARAMVRASAQPLDELLLPALRRATSDALRGDVSRDDERRLHQLVARVGTEVLPDVPLAPNVPVVLAVPARREAEVIALRLLARGSGEVARLEVESTQSLASELEARVERESPAAVVIAVIPPKGSRQAEYLCKRLRARFPQLPILVGYWGPVRDFDKLLVRLRRAGASYVSSTAQQTISQIKAVVPVPPASPPGALHAAASVG